MTNCEVRLSNMKPVPGYAGYYATTEGRVFGPKGEVIGSSNGQGHKLTKVKGKTVYLHRMVLSAFEPCPGPEYEVNHKDGDPTNNRLDNLEWSTHEENMQHAKSILKRDFGYKERSICGIDLLTGKVVIRFSSFHEAKRAGFEYRNIHACCKGRRKTHNGLRWEYG